MAQGGLYQVTAQGFGSGGSSAMSAPCYFQVVNSNPTAPSVGLAPGQTAPTQVGQGASIRIAGNLTNLVLNGGFDNGIANWKSSA